MQLKVSGPANRFCPSCRQDVADVGGYCLLGHDLRLASAVPQLDRLRTEVDEAFDDAAGAIERAFDDVRAHVSTDATPPRSSAPPPPPPPPPGPRAVPATAAPPAAPVVAVEDAGFVARAATVWRSLERDEATLAGDPIEAFAPPPRMDWGPERPALLRRSGARRVRLPLRRSPQGAH